VVGVARTGEAVLVEGRVIKQGKASLYEGNEEIDTGVGEFGLVVGSESLGLDDMAQQHRQVRKDL